MPLATPTGPISLIADRLATTLAAATAWADLSGTIHPNQLPPPTNGISHTGADLAALRPFALIWTTDDGYRAKRTTSGGGICNEFSGSLIIRLERNTPTGQTPAEVERDWENILGRIINSGDLAEPGLLELAGDPRYLPIDEITLLEHSRTAPEHVKDIGDAQRAFLLVEYST